MEILKLELVQGLVIKKLLTMKTKLKQTIQIAKCSLLFTLLLITTNLFSQSVNIQGVVLDSLNEPLVGATIILKHAADDKLEAFGITDKLGAFRLISKNHGDFILQITYIGYGTFERRLTLKPSELLLDFREIVLRQNAYQLDGITVEDSFIPIIVKKDTIEYNASAFQTAPNASVEDLLKKLPGIDVEKDGTIKAQGEEVQSITVDGKEFFGDDPKIASRNIPADVVDKVQLFDRKSEFTEFTGIDDGNETKAINLAIKEGKNKGIFGNVKAAYGTEDRYRGSTNLNRFTENMQLSAIGNVNNINEQAFSLTDYLKFTGGFDDLLGGEGIDFSQIPMNLLESAGNNDLYSGGLNFNYDFGQKTKWRSNYFFNQSKNTTTQNATVDNILSDGSFRNASNNLDNKTLTNHRFKFKLKHEFDKTQDFTANFIGGFSNTDSHQSGSSQARLNNDILINEGNTDLQSNLTNGDWKLDMSYRKKLKKVGRFLTTNFGVNGGAQNGDEWIANQTTFYENTMLAYIDSIDQLQNNSNNDFGYKAAVNYVEPLGKANYLNFVIARDASGAENDKLFSDKVDSDVYAINNLLSNNFQRDFAQNKLGLGYKIMRDKFTFSVGVDYQILDLKNKDQQQTAPLKKRFPALLPKANYRYSFNKTTQLSARYNTSLRAPSIQQLQPIIDNSNATNTYQGNPDLSAEYIHQLDVNYNLFDQFYFRSFFTGLRMEYIQDRITNAITVTDDLLRITQPVNSKDEWMLDWYYEYDSPVQGKNLKFTVKGDVRLQQSNVLTNDDLDRAYITSFSQKLSVENKKKEKVDWQFSARIRPNFTRYQNSSVENQSFFDYNLSTDFIWYIHKSWFYKMNLEYRAYSAADFGAATNQKYVNASLNKSFLENKLTLSIKGVNLLDEDRLIQRSSFGSQNSEVIRNSLGRYFLVGLVYKIRTFGK